MVCRTRATTLGTSGGNTIADTAIRRRSPGGIHADNAKSLCSVAVSLPVLLLCIARLRRLREQNHIVDSRPRGSRNYIPSARRIAALKNLPVLWESSASTQEIAEKIHYSVPQTFAFARLLKLPSRHRRHQKPLDEHRQAAIVILRESEWVFEDIAAILTISRQRAHQLWTKAQKQKTS